jgi:hypothetical protein
MFITDEQAFVVPGQKTRNILPWGWPGISHSPKSRRLMPKGAQIPTLPFHSTQKAPLTEYQVIEAISRQGNHLPYNHIRSAHQSIGILHLENAKFPDAMLSRSSRHFFHVLRR